MKKIAVFTLLFISTVIILSSCQSRGPKCPGMYSSVEKVNLQKPQ